MGTWPAIQSAFSLQMAIVFSVSMSKWKYAERQALPEMAGPFLWAVCSLQCCLWLHDLAGFCSLSISTSGKLPACWSVPVSASANIRCENLRSGSRRGGKEMNGPTVGHSQSALYICRERFMTPRTMCVQRECVKCPDALRLMYHLRSVAEFESNL